MNKKINVDEKIQTSYIHKKDIKKFSKKFEKVFKKIRSQINEKNNTLSVLNKNFKFNFDFKNLIKFKKFKTLVIIGMGGSILGSQAMYFFLKDKIKKKVYFLDDINFTKISNLKKKINLSTTLFIIISKSGNTIETLSNLFSLNILKKNAKNIIIISEKKNNVLFSLVKKLNLFYIEHKSFIGGRYSVLSEPGIVPAYLMGINIQKLRNNLTSCLEKKNKLFLKRSSIKLSSFLKKGIFKNVIFLNYIPELEKFAFWAQQLIAESLGKNKKGFLPVISNVPKDHHSLLQLYLDGPKDKVFNIFYTKFQSKIKIKSKNIDKKINFIKNKNLSTVKNAQKNALINVIKKNKIPHREFSLKKFDENTIGQLFAYFIIETVIIGEISEINPFNQPAVEEIKILTKKFLR